MKVRVNSKKGLKTILSILVDKKTIQKKLDEKLHELQHKVHLKGFRPGKVPPNVIKSQFGKAMIKHGYVQERDRNGRYWKGVSIFRLAA